MSTEKVTVSVEEKKKIGDVFKKFTEAPKTVTTEERNQIGLINEKLWTIKKDASLSIDQQNSAFEFISMTHKILGRDFKPEWKSKPKNSGGKAWIASKKQRSDNCDELIEYLKVISVWDTLKPFEQGMIIAQAWGSVKQ